MAEHNYRGKKAVAVTMSEVTSKIKIKLERMKKQEQRLQQQQAESYKSTISHEMRTPIQSMITLAEQML